MSPDRSCSLLAIALLRHLLVVTLLPARLGFLDLAVLALELLVRGLGLHDFLEQGLLPLLLGHSRAEVFRWAGNNSADLAELGNSSPRVLLVEPLGVQCALVSWSVLRSS